MGSTGAYALFVLGLTVRGVAMEELRADIFMAGIKGPITFLQTNVGDDIMMYFSLDIPSTSPTYDWSIHQFPVNYDQKFRCTEDTIGASVYPAMSGTVNQTSRRQMLTIPSPGVNLAGTDTLLGKSIRLGSVNSSACASILPASRLTTAVAHFRSAVGGTVTFRQKVDPGSSETLVDVDLFQLNENTTSNYTWQIHSNSIDMSVAPRDQCTNLGPIFNLDIGNLTEKFGTVSVGINKSSTRSVKVDLNLPMAGANSVLNRSLVIFYPNGSTMACANIAVFKMKEVFVHFSRDGVSGQITFYQWSPLDPTMVKVDLIGLRSKASGYHVHDFSVPQKMRASHAVCGNAEVSGHWNPFGWNKTESPMAGTGTSDQYEVGDLSGKFGTLAGKTNINDTYMDWNLPLFGANSIIGRSIVIHLNDGSRWICANIGFPSRVRTAVAVFKYPVIGHIMFRQMVDDPWSDTSISVDLNYGDSFNATSNHKWHIHSIAIDGDFTVETGRCKSAQGHYNPFNVELKRDYPTTCSKTNPVRCEVGDLAKKQGNLNIRASNGKAKKFYFTDDSLPLSGPLSIVGRSVVIHGKDTGGSRLACANIYLLEPIKAEVNKWMPESGVTGSIKFYQSSLYDDTMVDIDVRGLDSKAGGYHVHEYPIIQGAENPCSAASVAGHFNPFSVNKSASPVDQSGTMDAYEVGDMSGKYGSYKNLSLYRGQFMDNNMPLQETMSIVGRSVVIHWENGSRWVCGNIMKDLSGIPPATMYKAKATFSGEIAGYVLLSQVRFSDGRLGDTEVYVHLHHADKSVTYNTTWHIHERHVQVGGDCSTAGGHYNPHLVNTQNGYDECSDMNPLRCEVGDLAGKHGQYNIGGGPRFFTDVDVPLADGLSVLGRSFVFHAPGGKRIACADIIPVDVEFVTMEVLPPRPYFDKGDFVGAVSHVVKAPKWTVSARIDDSGDVSKGCVKVHAYFAGPQGTELKQELNRIIEEEPGQLGIYAPCIAAAAGLNLSVAVLLTVFSLKWLII